MQMKKGFKSKHIIVALSVFVVCVLSIPLLTGCGNRARWYHREWTVFYDGAVTDVTSQYEETTIAIDESTKQVTLFMLGDTRTFEYEVLDDNVFLVFNFNAPAFTSIGISRFGGTLMVYYTHSAGDNVLQKVLSMKFELESGNLYSLISADEVSDSGHTNIDIKSKGEVVIKQETQGVSVAPVTGKYTVSDNVIRVHDDKNKLVFVGTFKKASIDSDSKIEVDLTNPENADFAKTARDRQATINGNTVTLHTFEVLA
jgi:hypothetical protein